MRKNYILYRLRILFICICFVFSNIEIFSVENNSETIDSLKSVISEQNYKIKNLRLIVENKDAIINDLANENVANIDKLKKVNEQLDSVRFELVLKTITLTLSQK